MTVRKWFPFRNRSDVRQVLIVLVCLYILDNLPLSFCGSQENYNRDARRLFGGYRITPTHCKASREARYGRGSTICMFNHECVQRGGKVVGACMDGFLFGACCELQSDSLTHIPKGPGVVITSPLDYPDATTEHETDNDYEEELDAWHESYKPIVTPGYRPSDKNRISVTTEKHTVSGSTGNAQTEIISEGFSQITNTLLNSPPKDSNIIYIKPEKTDNLYMHSTIDHNVADTILLEANGSLADNIARPSDFNIQLSAMQTKPTVPSISSKQTTPKTVSTHRPMFTKPVFRPRPLNKTTTSTESYLLVSSSTKEEQKITELSSINSILQMLNESTPSIKKDSTSPSSLDLAETKSSLNPTGTVSPVSYSSSYPNFNAYTGYYVTPKPSQYSSTNSYFSNNQEYITTRFSIKPYDKYTTSNNIPQEYKPSSIKPSQTTSQAIDAFNRYPTNPNKFGDSVTTFSYVSPSTTTTTTTTTTRRPPSTSYVTGSKPLRRPVTPPDQYENYDAPDTFSSVTPTVIVLDAYDVTKTESSTEQKDPQFVEISQEPFKKPVSQIIVNNHIESTNNIYMNKPVTSHDNPVSPTILITPKPAPVTTDYPVKISTRPVSGSATTNPSFDSYTEYVMPSTLSPDVQTSSDDLINFPPVRNPLLNATGSNPAVFNTNVAISDNELDLISDNEFTTPIWQEDDRLNEKVNLFVNKIVGSLQGTFQELHDIVILDKKSNLSSVITTTLKPPKRTTTRKPSTTTTKRPLRLTSVGVTTKRPLTVRTTTKKPVKLSTVARKPTTTPPPTTTSTTTTTTTTTTRKPGSITKKTKPPKRTTTTTTTTTTELSDEVTTEEYVEQDIDYNDKSLCGVRPLARNGRIVGGKNSKFGDWPWQVLVRESTWLGLFTKTKCGGALISSRFVATAAHCQPGFLASLVAVFGEYDITGALEPKKPVSRNVRRVIVHRHFDATTFENDLALLELESPVKFDAHIIPICLPPDDTDFTGRMATVTGWGRLTYGGGVPPILQEVQVPVIENSVCQEMFQTAGHLKKILSSFLCAGYVNGQKDACEGDSGGPLVLQREDGRWQLIGTVSHGIKCAAPYLPGVYMRITYYKPWLKSVAGVH